MKNYYNNLMVALNSAAAGQTVVLMTNIDAGMIAIVPQNVTLDLNGYVVEADNFLSYGDVIDGAIGGVGGIEIPFNAYTILAQNNSFLPLYDSANGIYRLYKYEAKSLGVATVSDDKANFWFTIIFENHSAYQLLKNGDTGLTLEGILTWTGMTHDAVHVTIVQSSIDQWADAVQGGANAGSAGVYIGVTGLSTLEGGNVTIKPVLETKAGVQTNFTDLVKTVG